MTKDSFVEIIAVISETTSRLAGVSLEYGEFPVGGGWTMARRYRLTGRLREGVSAILCQGTVNDIGKTRKFIFDFLRSEGWPVGDSAEETRLKVAAAGDAALAEPATNMRLYVDKLR